MSAVAGRVREPKRCVASGSGASRGWHGAGLATQTVGCARLLADHRLLKLKRVVAMTAPKRIRTTKPTRISTHQPRIEYLYPNVSRTYAATVVCAQ